MNDQNSRYVRLRYTATGAVAALAAAGAIAGTVALAANTGHKLRGRAAAVAGTATNGGETKTPGVGVTSPGQIKTPGTGAPAPGQTKTGTPPPPGSSQPFLDAVQQLVDNGTISAAQGQVLDGEIQSGSIDTSTLAADGFSPSQLQAVQQTLATTKESLASNATVAGNKGNASDRRHRDRRRSRHGSR